MNRVMIWLQLHEKRLFFWCNHKISHSVLDRILPVLTHLGGAVFTIFSTLFIAVFAREPWSTAGWQGFCALALSHLPVALMKKKYPRLRPYLVLPEVNTGKTLLKDHSFPSGHTTAIFSVIVPFIFVVSWLSVILIPLAFLVGLSRMYLGLHYPSDCVAGCLIGTLTSILTVSVFF